MHAVSNLLLSRIFIGKLIALLLTTLNKPLSMISHAYAG